MSKEIKPCPFCGCVASVKLLQNGHWKVVCAGEICASRYGYLDKDMAVHMWNQRKKPKKGAKNEGNEGNEHGS